MPFVKLDCGILNSTLWFERVEREVFITALLMAEPQECAAPQDQLEVHSLKSTGWIVPPGWYGFVPAAGIGIIHRARVPEDEGYAALEKLGSPEMSSRSPDFDGRRLVRVDGGYLVLNFMKYRERDYTTAERSKRYRERQASKAKKAESHRDVSPSHRDITQAEAEAEANTEAEKIKNQDQDHRAEARNAPKNALKVLIPLAHSVMSEVRSGKLTPADAMPELKERAAKARIPYNATVASQALDVASVQKSKRRREGMA